MKFPNSQSNPRLLFVKGPTFLLKYVENFLLTKNKNIHHNQDDICKTISLDSPPDKSRESTECHSKSKPHPLFISWWVPGVFLTRCIFWWWNHGVSSTTFCKMCASDYSETTEHIILHCTFSGMFTLHWIWPSCFAWYKIWYSGLECSTANI